MGKSDELKRRQQRLVGGGLKNVALSRSENKAASGETLEANWTGRGDFYFVDFSLLFTIS